MRGHAMARHVYSCLAISILLFPGLGSAAVIHVPADQPTIQAGIDAAFNDDIVLIAPGTYTGEGNRDIELRGKRITVTSEAGASQTVIDCQGALGHRGFWLHGGETTASVIEGFTIRGGNILGNHGGGIFLQAAGATIRENIITDNYSGGTYGVAIAVGAGFAAVITGNTITNNRPSVAIGGGDATVLISGNTISSNYAGGIEFTAIGQVTVMNNVVSGNGGNGISIAAYSGIVSGNEIRRNAGRGILCDASCTCSIDDNLVSENGGGVRLFNNDCSLTNNTIEFNVSDFGGGIHVTGPNTGRVTGNTIRSNIALEKGGGIFCEQASGAVFESNVVASNEGLRGGGVYVSGSTGVSLSHNTFDQNASAIAGGSVTILLSEVTCENNIVAETRDGYGIFKDGPSAVALGCNDVWNNVEGNYWGCGPGVGDIHVDPIFCIWEPASYHLGEDSPCLSAGSCGLIGALGQGCSTSTSVAEGATEPSTWGLVKHRFETSGK